MTVAERPSPTRAREETIAEALTRLLADTRATYEKALFYHWNVTGPTFPILHRFFEEQYEALQAGMDLVAERIRQLGAATAPFEALSSLASVDSDARVPAWKDMVAGLAMAHEMTAVTARHVVRIAEEQGDVATADIVTKRIRAHEKAIWMLHATLGQDERS